VSAPAPDSLPLPGPPGLLGALLVGAFFLHALPLSIALGGAFWTVLAARRAEPAYRDLERRMARWLPWWTAAAVATGGGALVFLEALYGPPFFRASVVGAVPWVAAPAIALVGYAAYYLGDAIPARGARLALAMVALVAFAATAAAFSSQSALMLRPEELPALYRVGRSGWHLASGAAYWARALHVVLGAVALGGLWVSWLGGRAIASGDDVGGRAIVSLGARGFALVALLGGVAGAWFLSALPIPVARPILGGAPLPAAALAASALATLAAAALAWSAPRRRDPLRAVRGAAALAALVLLLMAFLRQVVRGEALRGAFDASAQRSVPEWGAAALLAAVLLAGALAVAWMARAAIRGRPR